MVIFAFGLKEKMPGKGKVSAIELTDPEFIRLPITNHQI
jgi:hypothetical protein